MHNRLRIYIIAYFCRYIIKNMVKLRNKMNRALRIMNKNISETFLLYIH